MGAIATGTDISAAQVDLAARRHPSISFEQANAQALQFADRTFDAVVYAFGLCHLPDPAAALHEFRRVLAPGGRVAYAVWDAPDKAVELGAVYRAPHEHGGVVDQPAGPDFFHLSDFERSRRAMIDAGFVDPIVVTVPQVWRVASADAMLDILATSSVRAGAALHAQRSAVADAIHRYLREALAVYHRGEDLIVPMPALIVSAVRT